MYYTGSKSPMARGNFKGEMGEPLQFQRVSHLVSVTAQHLSSRHQPKFAAFNMAPPAFDRAAITFVIGPHSSVYFCLTLDEYEMVV